MTARCRVHPDHLLLSIASINPRRVASIILGDSSIALSVQPSIVYGSYQLLDAGARIPIIRILFIYFKCFATISYERICGRYNDRARRAPPQSR